MKLKLRGTSLLSLLLFFMLAPSAWSKQDRVGAVKELVSKTVKDKATAGRLLQELNDSTIGNWVGLIQCKTSASDKPDLYVATEYKNEKRAACSAASYELFIGMGSKDLSCNLVDETFCTDVKRFEIISGALQKKPQNIPYLHMINKDKKNHIEMISPSFFKEIGLERANGLCHEKVKVYQKAGVKFECIAAKP